MTEARRLKKLGTSLVALLISFAMVVGFMPAVAWADDVKCTIKVVDSTGATVPDAQVRVVSAFASSVSSPDWGIDIEYDVTAEADGTFSFVYDNGFEDYSIRSGFVSVSAPGYKPLGWTSFRTIANYWYPTSLTVKMEQATITDFRADGVAKVNGYKDQANYMEGDLLELKAIIAFYTDKINDAETAEEIDALVEAAKADLDKVTVAQVRINDQWAPQITFTAPDGSVSHPTGSNGDWTLVCSLQAKEGVFTIPGQDVEEWKAVNNQWGSAGNTNFDAPYIYTEYADGVGTAKFCAYNIEGAGSSYMACSIPATATLSDGTVVSFTLKVVDRILTGVSVTAPKTVTLVRGADKTYSATVPLGEGGIAANAVYDDPEYVSGVTWKSWTEDVAEYVEGVGIVAKKEGTADFTVYAADDENYYEQLSITFVKSDDDIKAEQAEAAAAAAAAAAKANAKVVSNKIAALGTVNLSKEANVKAARAAYNKLNAAAKALVTNYSTLTKAEAKIAALKKVTIKAKVYKTSKKAKVYWSKVTDASKYDVYRSSYKTKGFKKVTTVKSPKRSFTTKAFKKTKTYYYKVRAYDKSGKLIATTSLVKVKVTVKKK